MDKIKNKTELITTIVYLFLFSNLNNNYMVDYVFTSNCLGYVYKTKTRVRSKQVINQSIK